MAWFSNKVRVTFIDDATGQIIKIAEMAPEDLPESFHLQTTLHLGDVDWSVMQAIPVSRPVYSRSKKLELHLRKVVKMDPGKILFSLPSICDQIPPLGGVPIAVNDLALHEDDWRQLELVSRRFDSEVGEEIESIRQIHKLHAAKMGWQKIHVRTRPTTPIADPVTLRDIGRVFGLANDFCGVRYPKTTTQIQSGYSFTSSDGQQFYGVATDGLVSVFAVAQKTLPETPLRSIESVEALAREFDLELVRWCKCERAGSRDPQFREILVDNAS
jgi:hypothetical protein